MIPAAVRLGTAAPGLVTTCWSEYDSNISVMLGAALASRVAAKANVSYPASVLSRTQ